MKKRYDTIALGASCAAIGYAAAHADTLILEATEMVGTDFAACLRPSAGTGSPAPQGPAEAFCGFLAENGVLRDGALDVPAMPPVLYRYLAAQEIPVMFLARPVSIARTEAGFDVEVITNEGMITYSAAHLLDTTPTCVSKPQAGTIREKRLNLLCHDPGPLLEAKIAARGQDGWQLLKNRRAGEYIVSLPFAPEVQLPEARAQIVEAWRDMFEEGEALISMLAFAFAYEGDAAAPVSLAPDHAWLPLAGGDAIAAFAAGAAFSFDGKGGMGT